MARGLSEIMKSLPSGRRAKIEKRADELASLADLRRAVQKTQEDLAANLNVGQDTVSRIERRSDMLISTLRRHIEGMGGQLELVARFPHRRPYIIDHLAEEATASGSRKTRISKTDRAVG